MGTTAIYLTGRYWEEAKKPAKSAYDKADSAMVETYEPSLINGVEAKLRGLKVAGVKLVLATNDRHDETEATMRRIGVVELYNAIVGADEVENPKPSPDSILLACKIYGCLPS